MQKYLLTDSLPHNHDLSEKEYKVISDLLPLVFTSL